MKRKTMMLVLAAMMMLGGFATAASGIHTSKRSLADPIFMLPKLGGTGDHDGDGGDEPENPPGGAIPIVPINPPKIPLRLLWP